MYSGYWIDFDRKSEWKFGIEYAKIALIFEVDTRSSCHTDNLQKNCSVLGEGDTFPFNESFVAHEKRKN